jgi:ribonuclease BN (tRNA processing enzyme)
MDTIRAAFMEILQMIITTLGTTHGSPTPGRHYSSTLVETGERSYLIDCGEPAASLLFHEGKDLTKLRAVFVTHMHHDHATGLPDLVKMIAKVGGPEQQVDIFLPEPEAFDALAAWLAALHDPWPADRVSVRGTAAGAVFDDGVLRVEACPTRHMAAWNAPSYSYVLRAEGKRVVFTGDLRGDFSDFPRVARDVPCDLCLCEMTHFKPASALPVLRECPIRRLVFNHVYDPWQTPDGETALRRELTGLPFPFQIAEDGDCFTV